VFDNQGTIWGWAGNTPTPCGLATGLESALRVCRTGVRFGGAGTFQPAGGEALVVAFAHWLGGDFRCYHAPQVARSFWAAREGVAEVIAADRDYSSQAVTVLGAAVRARSQARGGEVLAALAGARHTRVTGRFLRAVQDGCCEGHLASAFGCHTAELHVPLAQAIIALACLEWEAAAEVAGTACGLPDPQSAEAILQIAAAESRPPGGAGQLSATCA
jgi:hypothetical protein